MKTDELLQQLAALRQRLPKYGGNGLRIRGEGARAQVCEFLRNYAGPKSAFFKQAESIELGWDHETVSKLDSILESYREYVESGLVTGVSPERQAQIDVVSDILGQATTLLDGSAYHPAAAALLVGASLEEFLRAWVEQNGLSLGNAKPGIDAYCKVLRGAELISKQDVKDITSWAGTRNHAAHGEWGEVADRERIRLMLEGVNLFMRKNTR